MFIELIDTFLGVLALLQLTCLSLAIVKLLHFHMYCTAGAGEGQGCSHRIPGRSQGDDSSIPTSSLTQSTKIKMIFLVVLTFRHLCLLFYIYRLYCVYRAGKDPREITSSCF